MANVTKQELEKIVCEVMEIDTITPQLRKQISKYILEDKMTYLEIARCVVYYKEVENGVCKVIYGLWFVPSVREKAAKYFKKLEEEKAQQQLEAQKLVEYQENNIIFNIQALKHKKRKPRQLDISSINVEGEDNDGNN